MFLKCIILIFCILFFKNTEAHARISVNFYHVATRDALRFIANSMQMNVIISPQISDSVILNAQNILPEDAMNLILNSHGLSKVQEHGVWYIAPVREAKKLRESLLDAAELKTQVWQIHYGRAEEILHVINDKNNSLLSRRGKIHVDSRTNCLWLQDTPDQVSKINQLIHRLDIPVQQVLIEAKLASIDSDFARELGLRFELKSADISSGFVIAKFAGSKVLDVQLAALEKEGHAELISSPSLFTSNQQTASIEAGEEIPYQEISRSGATGVAFKKAVLSLKVTPQILPDSKVLLQLRINQDKPSNRMILGVPAITTRQISTQVLLQNGQTVVLGGIFEIMKDKATEQIPFFGKIPLVGLLFQQQNVTENKRELMIFVTPRIINTALEK